MMGHSRRVRAAALAALLLALTAGAVHAQVATGSTLGTLGSGVPGEMGPAAGRWTPPTGPAPRLAGGKPDFNGVWEHPYVPDMSQSNARNPALQKGAGPLPLTAAGLENVKSYNPERDGDYTGMCMPFGLTRSMNAPYPIQIMQNEKQIAFLFEQNNWFHVVPFTTEHPKNLEPTWFGDSIAKWDGDTLVIDTIGFNGYTRLDTRGNPHSDKLHVVQTFRHTDAGHIAYTVTVEDPVFYSTPWKNERTFTLTNGELIEYSCEENNRSLWEGRIKLWTPPGTAPLRNPVIGAK